MSILRDAKQLGERLWRIGDMQQLTTRQVCQLA
jgi:hypothetical protein